MIVSSVTPSVVADGTKRKEGGHDTSAFYSRPSTDARSMSAFVILQSGSE